MFDWDEANVSHIARHGVLPHEAEEVILSHPLDISYVTRNGEERIEQLGETLSGRILSVVSTMRGEKIRVITAIPLRSRYHSRYFKMKEERDARKKNSS